MADNESEPTTGPVEPCLVCGEETAVGSVFYSDRWNVSRDDGSTSCLCSLCGAHVGSSARGKRLTDDELRSLVANGSMAAVKWVDRGAF